METNEELLNCPCFIFLLLFVCFQNMKFMLKGFNKRKF